MTNKELADCLEKCTLVLRSEDVDMIDKAIDRLRSLPDPTPEPVKDLRWLVERHGCLRAELEWDPDAESDKWPWYSANEDETTQAYFSDAGAMLWIRGIVKAMCDEWSKEIPHPDVWQWLPLRNGRWAPKVPGRGCIVVGACDTEIEAIDALLTAMEGKD